MYSISPSTRLRPSPFYNSTIMDGVCAMTIYNHMLMPTSYGQLEAEYWRIIQDVSMWDVAVERQVQLKGPDAKTLAQILVPRDLSDCKIGQGKYAPLCNHHGILINDPILLKRSEDCYWLSIADSNIWFWAEAIAQERRLSVEISEPDVSPLAVQGPKAESVIAAIFGDWIRDLKYFWFRETRIQDIPVLLARSGWSKQGGFEIYLMDGAKGDALWQIVKEAGQPYGIGPGNPNWCERVESGLLSFGGDTDKETNPFEVRLEKYIDVHIDDETIGIQALREIKAKGPKRHQLGIVLNNSEPVKAGFSWHEIQQDGKRIGDMTNCVWSFRMEKNIGYALIKRSAKAGETVDVKFEDGFVKGTLCELPFL